MSDDKNKTESLNIFRRSAQSHNKNLQALRAMQDSKTSDTPRARIPAREEKKRAETVNRPETKQRLKEKQRSEDSAGVLVSRLAAQVRRWQTSLPDDKQSIIVAVLANGTVIPVSRLESDGHHGLVIHGDLDDSPCMIVSHQNNLTLLCTTTDKKSERDGRQIEFYVDGKKLPSED